MKIRFLATTFAAAILFTGSLSAQAVPPQQKSQTEMTEMTEMCKRMDAKTCQLMMREMVKRQDLHQPMAAELMHNPAFVQTWQELHKHQSAHGG